MISPTNPEVAAGWPNSLVRLRDEEKPVRSCGRRMQRVMPRTLEGLAYAPDEILGVRCGLVESVNGSHVVGCYPSAESNEHRALLQVDLTYAGLATAKVCRLAIRYYRDALHEQVHRGRQPCHPDNARHQALPRPPARHQRP